MASKGRRCLGVLRTASKCRRARNGKGGSVCLKRKCLGCQEWRCRAHCKCGRESTAVGRAKARGLRVAAPAAPAQRAAVAQAALPCDDEVEVHDETSWMRRLLRDLPSATSILLATYMYDAELIHNALMGRLTDGTNFKLEAGLPAQHVIYTCTCHIYMYMHT